MGILKKSGIMLCMLIGMLDRASGQAPTISYPATNVLHANALFTVSPSNSGGAVPATAYGQVTTFAGSIYGAGGYKNSTGTDALFYEPRQMTMDASGNLYLADKTNNAIREITPAGLVTTFAGSPTGVSGYKDTTGFTAALFNGPTSVAIDASGNFFVSDYNNNAIRKITPAGVVSTFYSQASLGPYGICFDSSGNLIVTAQGLGKILKISPSGVPTVIAGSTYGTADGTGSAAQFSNPTDSRLDPSGNIIVMDYNNNSIRKVTPAGQVTTLAGSTVSGNAGGFLDGVGTAARFNGPRGVAIAQGGVIYVADNANNDVRRIMPDGTVTLIAGSPTQVQGRTNGVGTAATFFSPLSIYVDNTGMGYVVDEWATVRKLVLTGYTLKGTLPAGLGFNATTGVITGTPTGITTAVTDTIMAFNASGYSTTTITFTPGTPAVPGPSISYTGSTTLTAGTAFTLSPSNSGGAVPATTYGQVSTFVGSLNGTSGFNNATGPNALFNQPKRMAMDASGNIYLADKLNNMIREITPAGVVTTFAGSPTGVSGYKDTTGVTNALFNGPVAVAIDASGNFFISDYNNNAIRKITPAGVVSTFYTQANLGPSGICFDSSGNLIVTAQMLRQILKISPTGVATVIAGSGYGYVNGTGTAAQFENPADGQLDLSGNIIVADYLNNAIRKVTPAGVVTTLAGSTVSGNTGSFLDGVGTAARFNNPTGVAITQNGVIYVTDFGDQDIRRIMPDGTVTLIVGSPAQASGNTDGIGTAATFNGPISIIVDNTGTGYVVDMWANVRKLVLTGYTLKGTLPAGLAFDPTTGTISGTPTGTITMVTDTITAYNATGYSTTMVTFGPPAPRITYAGSAALTAGTAFTISPVNSGGAVPATTYGQVTTFAGSIYGSAGYTNSTTGTGALFNEPRQMAIDGSGNLYLADKGNNAIRKITPGGVVTTFAGSPTGVAGYKDTTGFTAALFNGPAAVAIDGSGNFFISDYNNNAIRKITPSGVVSTFYTQANLAPYGLCFDGSGNLIVASQGLTQILKISPSGVATSIAGNTYGYVNGTGSAALFSNLTDVKLDLSGNIIVGDYQNNAIRKVTPAGVVTTLAGSTVNGNTGGFLDGVGTAALFNNPRGVAIAQGGVIYVADFKNNDIRRVTPDGTVATIAGSLTHAQGFTDGVGTAATLYAPLGIYVDNTGMGYVVDEWATIRKLVLTGYSLKGTLPAGLAFDAKTGTISGTPTGTITTVTDTVTAFNISGYSTAYITFGPAPTISYGGSQSNTFTVGNAISPITPTVTGGPVPYSGYTTTFAGSGAAGTANGIGTSATFALPDGLTVDSKGNVYVTDIQNVSDIRKITPSGLVSTLAGSASSGFADGTGINALFHHPLGISTDTAGNVYVADESNNAIRKITTAGVVTTLAGGTQGSADGVGTAAQFYLPTGTTVDASGNVFVADYWNNKIRKITPDGTVSTIAGGTLGYADGVGTAAQFYHPNAIKVDASGNLYVTDRYNQRIRKIDPTGLVTTIAGNGTVGFSDGQASSAEFNYPSDLAVDNSGNIYVSDYYNRRIRRIGADGMVSTLAGTGAAGTDNGVGNIVTFGGVYNAPAGISFDGSGSLFETDYGSNLIRKTVTTPYTISPKLPAGMSFDSQTGIITGTPTVASTPTTYTITAYNMVGIGTTEVTIGVTPVLPNNPANDFDKNWIYTRTYDENGRETGATKSFYDYNGKATQAQLKNETTGHVLASQTLYDVQGRAVATTLAAPTNNSAFAYKNNFVTSDGTTAYNYLNFDGDPASALYGKVNNPDGVDKSTIGSLGWYYSDNNTFEPYVASTAFPYSRTDYYRDGSGVANRSAGIGEQLKMGMGHETTASSFPVQHELDNYLAIRNQFFASAAGASPTGMAGQALQNVATDQNGTAVLTITDLAGKQSLMTGRADAAGWLSVQNSFSLTSVHGQYSFNIHLDGPSSVQGNTNDPQVIALMHGLILNFGISSNTTVTVTCTNNSSIAPWTGIGSDYVHPLPTLTGTYTFTITSDYPFTVSATNAYGTVYDQAEATYAEPSGSAVQYFQLTSPSTAAITGSFSLYNMSTNTDVTSTFSSGTTVLPAGYYKVSALTPAAGNPPNTVTVGYTNKYSDISYNYYDQLGQLIASIAPNGVQQLIQNGYSGITSASQLPFVSLYSYDLQGRLTSVKTPDAGTSNFIYRQDGKIRFSQNAYQANSANAGTGNFEKFSYTNYDDVGRPVESGELAVTSATFASLSSNTTMLESTDPVTSTPAGTKLSQINTYYDTPATNLSLTGYVQDPGFLKGAVSYTSNANSTTWYNCDDHGRVTWTVKQIAGLPGYKTVDYTYNDQGNVTKADYQKSTASERFIHYYAYDADGRLTNVQTSRDDIAKTQQANYYYYLHGPLKRVELGDQLQGIDYVYTPQGWLKSVNTPTGNSSNDPGQDGVNNNFAKDAFGMQMEYFPGDYNRTGSNINSVPIGQQTYYNGNVNGIGWQSNKPASVVTSFPNIQNPAMYAYSYDPKYQLTGATWGTPNYSTSPSFTAGNTFSEKNMDYDPNGNINGLQRTNSSGILTDDFSKYTYQNGTNQLLSVGNTANPSAYASYTYNEIGQLKSETLTGAPNPYYLQYDVTGKITGIYSDAALTNLQESYTYDESGNRIKSVSSNGTTYYVYDTSGNVIAIYTGTTPAISELPFYGSNRLGTYTFSSGNYLYELRDNVGSVRAVMNRTKKGSGQADIITYNDYYAYGSIAQSGGTNYRYDYQGAYSEKDQFTNWNNFQLRMYDGKIGRWLTTDPKNVGFSPYNGVGNNPVTSFDKDGGEFWDDFTLTDNKVTLTKATNDKFDQIFNEKGELLFRINKDPNSTQSYMLTNDHQHNNEIAWSVAKFSYFVKNQSGLSDYLASRASETGWDISRTLDALNDMGGRNLIMKNVDNIMAFTPLSKFYPDQNMREGKPKEVIGSFSEKLELFANVYNLISHGSLQDDITHPSFGTTLPKDINTGRNFFEEVLYQWHTGIDKANRWLSNPSFGH